MSDDKPLNQSAPDGPQSEDLPPEDPALAELQDDLSVYDNSEVFYDDSLPFRPRFQIESGLLENTLM